MNENDDLLFWAGIIDKLGPEGVKKLAFQSTALLMENIRLNKLLGNKINQTVDNLERCCCEDKRNMEELKNCPFCGGKAIIRRRNPDHIMRDKYFACCTSCKNKTGYYDTEEEAVVAWNKRVGVIKTDINYCPYCGKELY